MARHRAVSAFARVLQQSSRRSQWACSFVPQSSSSVAPGVGAGAAPTYARALGLQALRTQGWGATAAAVSRRCIATTVQPANEHTATFGAGAGGTRGAGDAGSRKKGPGSSQGSTSGSSKPAIIADVSIDYYTVLGVGRRATSEDIKSAYRTLAKTHHPDLNNPQADADLFTRANEAYAVLSDNDARSAYDANRRDHLNELRLRNEGSQTGFTVAGDELFRKSMFAEGERYRAASMARGAVNRAKRTKVDMPTRKQTYWRMLFPVSIILLWIFNAYYFNYHFS